MKDGQIGRMPAALYPAPQPTQRPDPRSLRRGQPGASRSWRSRTRQEQRLSWSQPVTTQQRMNSEAAFAAPERPQPRSRIIGTDSASPAQPRRQPASQQRAVADRYQPNASRPPHQRVCHQTTSRRKTQTEIIRCLKRHIAREIYHLLTDPPPTPHGTDLRHYRTQARITLTQAAHRLDTQPTLLSQLERGLYHNHQLAIRYQHWLTQQPICTIIGASS